MMQKIYNGGLTREQFLFHEIRIVASMIEQGIGRKQITEKIQQENLFQFPTERMVNSILGTCFRRIDALNSPVLVQELATASVDVAKQINLYAMMKYNRVVWDFMTTVIGEKYQTRDFDFSKKDLRLFFCRLQEQNDDVAGWSEQTISKIMQVLTKTLVECGYLDSVKSQTLNAVCIVPELEYEIKEKHDLAALPAFNCFV